MGNRTHIRRFVHKYLPKCCRVFVSRSHFAVLWVTPFGHVWRGLRRQFLGADAESQLGEVLESTWRTDVKRKDTAKLKGSALHADPGDLKVSYPSIAEFMTAAVYEGGKDRRESPTVTLWCTAGTWRASIKDRAEGLVLWLSAPGFLELIALMEDFVLSAEAPWRHDEAGHERNGKRAVKRA